MCGLFGFSDPSRCLSPEQARLLTRALAESSMVRGTDATGIAYNARHWLHIFKRAEPASCVPLFPPAGVHAIMGHVRLTTQGNARSNHNNHPFPGMLDGHRETKGPDFALAHNGVLQNDRDLRLRLHLPETTIETDSYVAVQMLEALGTLDLPHPAGGCRTAGGDLYPDVAGSSGHPVLCPWQQSSLSGGISASGALRLCQHGGDSPRCREPPGFSADAPVLSHLAGGG